MHAEARRFLETVALRYPAAFTNVTALDAGGCDINGHCRYVFRDSVVYVNDLEQSPGITHVCRTADLPFQDLDTITCSESLEHDNTWADSVAAMTRFLRPGGLMALTCASTGRPEHGTRRCHPNDSLTTRSADHKIADHYKNLTADDICSVPGFDGSWEWCRFWYNAQTCDLYMVGIKKGGDAGVDRMDYDQGELMRELCCTRC